MLKTSGRWTLLFIAAALWGCSSTPSPTPDTAAASPTPAAAAGLERGLCSAISEDALGRTGRFADNHSLRNLTLCAQAGARPTTLVVTAVDKQGQLDPSFPIQVLELKPDQPQQLPFGVSKPTPVSLYVAFLETPGPDLQALLAGCRGSRDPKAAPVKKLMSSFSDWISEDSKDMARHGEEVQPAGGSQPGPMLSENPGDTDDRIAKTKPADSGALAAPAPPNEPVKKDVPSYDWRADRPDQVAYGPNRHGVKVYKLR